MVAEAFYPDPKHLYDPDPNYIAPIHHVAGPPALGIGTGILIHLSSNYFLKRPYRTGIYMYGVYAAVCGVAFHYIGDALKRYYKRRDTIYKHYIHLHPELFPPPPKIKIGELLEDWKPTR